MASRNSFRFTEETSRLSCLFTWSSFCEFKAPSAQCVCHKYLNNYAHLCYADTPRGWRIRIRYVSDTDTPRICLGYVSSRILKMQIRFVLDTCIRHVWARWDTAHPRSNFRPPPPWDYEIITAAAILDSSCSRSSLTPDLLSPSGSGGRRPPASSFPGKNRSPARLSLQNN